MGILFILNQPLAASLYGVPLSGGSDDAYLSAAAVRDVAVGVLTLVLALLRDKRAVGIILLVATIIPIGDGLIVLRNSPAPWHFLPLHWGGAVGCLAFALILLWPRATRP
jgi:hypothetical protein